MDVFDACHEINELIIDGKERPARDALIKLLAKLENDKIEYPDYLNEIIRSTGLFPYMKWEGATWDQKYVQDAFAVDVGNTHVTLHREQSLVLRKLLEGKDLAISAPTSFGKSFIIDAYIAARRPKNVVIIVPTIALMDETRRRIFKKFSREYEIITTPYMEISERNIFIFPQERVFSYINQIQSVDLLVIDEFYKASAKYDKDRSPALVKAIIQLSRVSKQRYYLAPNIKRLGENIFTSGMEFIELLDFNTVFLEKNDLSPKINGDIEIKKQYLLEIIGSRSSKTLIYAGNYTELDRISKILIKELAPVERSLTLHFSQWLRINYKEDWQLADLIERGVGVHNGQMHRCLSQIQVRIFEAPKGFDSIISTSSIIEGVNTSAENVILWRSRIANRPLEDFTYKNIIGRGGRMFKYFVGKIFLFEPPPPEVETQLELTLPDKILGGLSDDWDTLPLNNAQIDKIRKHREMMSEFVGKDNFDRIKNKHTLNDPDADFILELARDMRENPAGWRGFAFLNSDDPNKWDNIIYKIIRLKPGAWDGPFSEIVSVTKIISNNWQENLPVILQRLDRIGIGIDKFFKIERTITFKLAALVNDVNELHKSIIDPNVDVSRFVARLNHAFLPKAVYSLEEFGLPRMISRKIHQSGYIDFQDSSCDLAFAIERFRSIGIHQLSGIPTMSAFDKYILRFFFDGINSDEPKIKSD